VRLGRKWYKDLQGLDVLERFNPCDLPWSSYHLYNLPTGSEALHNRFLDTYGPHLWMTEIGSELYSSIADTLGKTPNLRSLTIFAIRPDERPTEFGQASLKMLKSIKLDTCDGEMLRFLEWILNSEAPLKHLSIRSIELDDEESAERVAKLFAKIPFLNVAFGCRTPPSLFSTLATQKLWIRELKLHLDEHLTTRGNTFGHYGQFFASLEVLEKVEMVIQLSTGKFKPPCIFQNFRRLKSLKFDIDTADLNPSLNFITRFFQSNLNSQF